ncbi:hypothetical protein [Enterococcus faecalis]
MLLVLLCFGYRQIFRCLIHPFPKLLHLGFLPPCH